MREHPSDGSQPIKGAGKSAATVARTQRTSHSDNDVAPAVIADDIALSAAEGRVFGHLSFTVPGSGLTVLSGRGGSGRTSLALSISGRDGKSEDVSVPVRQGESDDAPILGITIKQEPADGTTIDYHLDDIGGPSAGLMFTLAVVDKLTPEDLTDGKFIAGTGTIDADGDVGPIGGISHKIDAAKKAGAMMFMTPSDNCAEAMSGDHDGVVLAKVNNLSDAVTALKDVKVGKKPTTCS